MLEFSALPAVKSFLGDATGPMLGRAAGTVVGKQLGKILEQRRERNEAAKACASAFDLWLAALHQEYAERNLEDSEIEARFSGYLDQIESFLEDDEASAELLRPFTEPVPNPSLNTKRLLERWRALELPALPEGFDLERACRWYVEELNRLRGALDVLRPLWQVQAQQRMLDLAAAIRGPWAEWDPDQYADAVRETYQAVDVTTLELSGRQGGGDDDLVRLRDIFVPQDARRSRPQRILPRDYLLRRAAESKDADPGELTALAAMLGDGNGADDDDRWEKTAREPILHILTSEEVANVVVLGDPGAGKSCLARYVALCTLEALGKKQRQPEPAPSWVDKLAGRLPFLIELRRFVTWEDKGGKGGYLGYLHHLGCDRGFSLNSMALDRHLLDAPSLVIFDGLDEVINLKAREEVADAITGFARRYPRSKVIVTSRIIGFDARPFLQRAAGFKITTLDDLNSEQIRRFSETWFRLSFRSDPERASQRHEHLLASVASSPQLRALAGNPLLLTIIALIARKEELRAQRADLYAHALRVFSHQWDFEDKKLELPWDSPLRELDDRDKQALLRHIAWSINEAGLLGANVITRDLLQGWIIEFFQAETWYDDRRRSEKASREMVSVLEQRNYVLCEQGGGLYGFIHRTFQEFLCADQILWRIEKTRELAIEDVCRTLVQYHADDESWHEIVRLLVAQIQPPQDAAIIIEALLDIRIDRWSARQGRFVAPALILAIECLRERRPRDRRYFESVWTRIIHLALEDSCGAVRAAAVIALGTNAKTDDQVRARLVAWTDKDDDAIVRSAAVEALGAHAETDSVLRALLIAKAEMDDAAQVRIKATEALRAVVSADSEVRAHLIACADKDQDAEVRAAAIRVLAAHAGKDGAVRARLMASAERDGSLDVRVTAILALGIDAVTELRVRKRLIEWTEQHEDNGVSFAALFSLGMHAGTDAELRAWLITRANNIADPHRAAVILSLVARARTDAEARAWLITCAEEDDDSAIRPVVVRALGAFAGTDSEVRARLIAWAENDDEGIRTAARFVLQQQVAGDAEVRARLIVWAEDDDDVQVRSKIVRALGAYAGADTKVRARLIRWAEDDVLLVRSAAAEALGAHAASDAGIRARLLGWVEKDDDAAVRLAAVEALRAHAGTDWEVRARLLGRVEKDDDAAVRLAAVEALRAHAGTDGDVRARLLARVEKDDDAAVRQAVVEYWVNELGDRRSGVLLSRSLDGFAPWWDPRGGIAAARVAEGAKRLRISEEEVRAIYEAIAQRLPLILEWAAEKADSTAAMPGQLTYRCER